MIGYDLDGVIAEYSSYSKMWYGTGRIFHKLFPKTFLHIIRTYMKCLYKPTEERFFILTARSYEFLDTTENWLEFNNIEPEFLFMYPGGFNDSTEKRAEWKAQTLKIFKDVLNTTVYFDDDVRMINRIKELNPELKVTLWKRNEGM